MSASKIRTLLTSAWHENLGAVIYRTTVGAFLKQAEAGVPVKELIWLMLRRPLSRQEGHLPNEDL
jgi:hypothetical protein